MRGNIPSTLYGSAQHAVQKSRLLQVDHFERDYSLHVSMCMDHAGLAERLSLLKSMTQGDPSQGWKAWTIWDHHRCHAAESNLEIHHRHYRKQPGYTPYCWNVQNTPERQAFWKIYLPSLSHSLSHTHALSLFLSLSLSLLLLPSFRPSSPSSTCCKPWRAQ